MAYEVVERDAIDFASRGERSASRKTMVRGILYDASRACKTCGSQAG